MRTYVSRTGGGESAQHVAPFATIPIPRRDAHFPFSLPGASFRAYAFQKGERRMDGRTKEVEGGEGASNDMTAAKRRRVMCGRLDTQ